MTLLKFTIKKKKKSLLDKRQVYELYNNVMPSATHPNLIHYPPKTLICFPNKFWITQANMVNCIVFLLQLAIAYEFL